MVMVYASQGLITSFFHLPILSFVFVKKLYSLIIYIFCFPITDVACLFSVSQEVARKLRILLVLEIYLRYLEKYGSGICTFECHDKNGATKRLKSGKIVGIINKQLVKAPIIGCDFHFNHVENTLVLSQLNDEILQTCIKKLQMTAYQMFLWM